MIVINTGGGQNLLLKKRSGFLSGLESRVVAQAQRREYINFHLNQIHQARQFLAKPENTVHSNVTAQPSTLAVSRNALRNIPKAPFQSLGIE